LPAWKRWDPSPSGINFSFKSHPSITALLYGKEISPEYSLERLMLKLKLQHSGHLMLGKIEGKRRRE